MIYNNICTLNTNKYSNIYYSFNIYNDLCQFLDSGDIKNIDKFLYPIHAIYYKSKFDKTYKNRSFVQLKADYLRKTIGDKYKKVIDFLIKYEFIECDGIWAAKKNCNKGNGKCLGYKLTEKYENEQFILKKTNKLNLSCFELKLSKNHKYLLELLDDITLDLNLLPELQEEININSKTAKSKSFASDFFYAFNNKEYHFSIDKNSGRIFNIIVNAPRFIRQFLLYKDQPLKELDIRAAQPLLLNLLYKDSDTIEERIRFKYITENDDFYTFLLNNSELNISRDKAKKILYYYLFGELTDYDNLIPVRDFFQKHFPILLERIEELKIHDYKQMALFLQKKEANAIINNVVSFCRINKIPVFPIHDSFMLLEEHIDLVQQEIIRVFNKLYNLTPQLVVKELRKNIVNK